MKLVSAFLTVAALTAAQQIFDETLANPKKCTLSEDLEYTFSECNEDTGTLTVLFFYANEKRCNIAESEVLPRFMQGVPCKHLCEDGFFTGIEMNE